MQCRRGSSEGPSWMNVQNHTSDIIKLNVGGTLFTTYKSTLTKYPESMLAAVVSGTFEPTKDESGRIFIDRDGHLFRDVLAYLRDGPYWIPPRDTERVEKLAQEFQYYNLCVPQMAGVPSRIHEATLVLLQPKPGISGPSSEQGLYLYNSILHKWLFLDQLPAFLDGKSVAGYSGHLYFTGGWTDSTATPTANLEMYSLTTKKMSSAAPMLMPRSQHASVFAHDKLYVMGSCSGVQLSDSVEYYNTATDSWVKCAPLPEPLHRHAATTANGCVYACGGMWQGTGRDSCYMYDPRTSKWKELRKMLGPRWDHNLVATGDMLYVVGGMNHVSPSQVVIMQYDTRMNCWSKYQNGLCTDSAAAAIAVELGRLLVFDVAKQHVRRYECGLGDEDGHTGVCSMIPLAAAKCSLVSMHSNFRF